MANILERPSQYLYDILATHRFEPHNQILGWVGFARIDGTVWEWLGDNTSPSPNISHFTDLEITPTRTIYQFSAGPMNLTITYLTPIEVSRLVAFVHT